MSELESQKQRQQLCVDLGLYYVGIAQHGDSLILLDRLIEATALLESGILAMNGRARVMWADKVREFLR